LYLHETECTRQPSGVLMDTPFAAAARSCAAPDFGRQPRNEGGDL